MSTALTGAPSGASHQPGTDPLLHPDPAVAAEHAGAENLLRCWVRETGAAPGPDGVLHVPVLGGAARLVAPVRYWSPCGWHRFGPVTLGSPTEAGGPPAPVDAVTVAALIGATTERGEGGHLATLVAQVADSVARTAGILAYRRTTADPEHLPFLRAEQSLLLGHPQHPAPKGRDGLAPAQSAAYSPETHGAFRLHWYAVDRELLAADSAEPLTAEQITARLLGDPAALPPGTAALPVHPWQAGELALRPAVAALLEQGRLHDLGPRGEPWHPTSSVRTVLRPGTPWMLKLSLGLRITNSRRENLRKELHRGLEVHRLLEAGLAAEWRAAHPGFDIVRDPAWIGLDAPGLPDPNGLDTVVRRQPFGPDTRVHCVAGLVAEQPLGDTLDSALAGVLRGLAARTAQPLPAVAAEWFRRYLDAVVLPVLWLDGRGGIALEAHQQNTLVLLDADGWPAGGRYRDNQGYYFRRSRAGELSARLPGIGAASDTFVPDQVADERFCYYLGINHVLGLTGAFGAQRLADEQQLLTLLRRFLAGPAAAATGSSLPAHLLDAPTLRCKANLLTRLRGLDELVGPVATQSVYVTVPNPVAVP
ncbi:IucA/IucC family protein [Streptomyces sp. Tu 3180]|uniref:IucA/IucC family protein n=1 Tax=Streptomyces sp. Tu 3180 TaxID=2682611 RepID=UPI001358F1CC|nr:IucA/IucC family protein [Streptomyces sp. Tu 3180]KAF3467933.1 siderophore biosynthesis protein [Streptomyces sp. Tu 3180]